MFLNLRTIIILFMDDCRKLIISEFYEAQMEGGANEIFIQGPMVAYINREHHYNLENRRKVLL